MPTLAVARDYLFKLLGKSYTDDQFDELCFQFGVELDDITSEREMYIREQGHKSQSTAEKLSDDVIYKIDTPANRYDLLCAEGMSIALKVFLGAMPVPQFRVLNATKPLYHMFVRKSVKNMRDYVVCAVLKNIQFNQYSYNSFIDFQEKLHSGLARRRTLASVGTHDLDKINSTEFEYELKPKDEIKFIPLRQTKLLDCAEDGLEKYYAEDRHIRKYVPIISSWPAYPLITEAVNHNVLSLPPVINSAYSAVSQRTRNIFIECTAPDHYRAQVLVNQIVCTFSMYCDEPFTVEAVKVEYEATTPDGIDFEITPNLSSFQLSTNVKDLNAAIGIDLETDEKCCELLRKMMYNIHSVNNKIIIVDVPAVRSDVISASDIMEDVAIAYGYDNIKYKECFTHGLVTQSPLNKLAHLLRIELANAGYVELLTFSLCSRDEAFAYLGRVDKDVAVHIANPKTIEFQICRPSLLPGILKTASANKSQPLPLRFFECADVIMIDNDTNFPPMLEEKYEEYNLTKLSDKNKEEFDEKKSKEKVKFPSAGARNQRRIAALHCQGNSSSFESIHGLVEYTLLKLGLQKKCYKNTKQFEHTVNESKEIDVNTTSVSKKEQQENETKERIILTAEEENSDSNFEYYTLEKCNDDGAYFPGRAMNVILHSNNQQVVIGSLGVIHPNTLKLYDMPYPCSYMEINVQFLA